MSSQLLEKMDQNLRAGKPEQALAAALAYTRSMETPPKEQGIAIAKAAANVYRDLIGQPVHKFYAELESNLPEEQAEWARKALGRLIRMTDDWDRKLWDVHVERLARDMRDHTRDKNFDAAMQNLSRLMWLAPEKDRLQRSKYVGTALGTLINQRKEAEHVLKLAAKDPSKWHLGPEEIGAMATALREQADRMMSGRTEFTEGEWKRTLGSVSLEIKDHLPPKNAMEDPDENQIRDICDVFRSILRVPILHEEPDLFLDATLILVEYSPKETANVAKMAGVEDRIYFTLGFSAKKAVALAFQEIGKNEFFCKVYEGWAKDYIGTDMIKPIVEFVGALRSETLTPFLMRIQGDKKAGEVQKEVAHALSNVAGVEAVETIKADLKRVLESRLDAKSMKEAERLLASLGRICRSPRTDVKDRKSITEFIIRHVPEDQTRLAMTAALKAIAFNVDELTSGQRQWGVRVLVRALWLADESTVHHKGGDKAEALGFRGPIVDALKRLGPREMETLLKTMEPLSMRYSPAFLAAAELMEALDDERCLGLLEKMLLNTVYHDSAQSTAYQKEMYWDPTQQKRVEVTPEMIMSNLVHAIGKIGGKEAQRILLRYQQLVQSGRIPAPDPQTANFLQRFLGDVAFIGAGARDQSVEEFLKEEVTAEPGEVKKLIKQLTKSYFFKGKDTKRMKKVQALTRLGQIAPPEAIDAIAKQFKEKDPMIVSAAITCLRHYGEKSQRSKEMIIDTCIDLIEGKDPAIREGAVKVLQELHPLKPENRSKISKLGQTADSPQIKEAFEKALKPPSLPGAKTQEGGGDEATSKKAPESIQKLELKRQYLQARQDWIRSGKKGDPPPKPEGLD